MDQPAPTADDLFLSLFRQILSGRTIPAISDFRTDNKEAAALCEELIRIREVLHDFAKGNLDNDIDLRGGIAGNLKALQANLRHLSWQVQQVATGDFSQRVDFMGTFSSAFNSMVVQLDRSLTELKESESRLLNLTLELQDEVRQRRRAEKILKQSEERWNLAVECSRDGIWDINLDSREAWYSDRFMEMFGYSPDDLPKDLRWDLRVHPDDAEQADFLNRLLSRKIDPQPYTLEYRHQCRDGEYLWVREKGMPVRTNEDTPSRIIGVTSDISLQKETERSLAFQAMHDNLTGLPNRYLLEDRLHQHIAQSKRTGNSFILVMLDLDDFKGVNDTWGHAAGDRLLIELANRICSCLRDTDTVARLGGDEFVFIYMCQRDREETATELVLNRLYDLFQKPVDLGPADYRIGSSAGVAFYPRHSESIPELFEKADEALYQAKERGKNTFVIWQKENT